MYISPAKLHTKLSISFVVMCVLSLFAWTFVADAAFNQQINYQGKLTDNVGATVTDGIYDMEFRLYTQASGGSAIWLEYASTTVSNGLFSHMLGTSTSLANIDFDQTLYLGVTIGTDSEMTPRKILGAVPAAFEAKQLDGLATTSFLRSDVADTADALITFSAGASTSDLVISGAATTTDLTVGGTASSTDVVISNNVTLSAHTGGLLVTNNAGVLSASTSISDSFIEDNLTLGSGATFANDIVTPNAVQSTGQNDEYCLTYETTGTTWEWQDCAGSIANDSLDWTEFSDTMTLDATTTIAMDHALNFDSNTFYIDGQNDRVGVGTTSLDAVGLTAAGISAPVHGTYNQVFGPDNTVNSVIGNWNTVVGSNNTLEFMANGETVLVGSHSTTSSQFGTLIGADSELSGNSSVLVGSNSSASGGQSVVIGAESDITGARAVNIGYANDASATGTIAIGSNLSSALVEGDIVMGTDNFTNFNPRFILSGATNQFFERRLFNIDTNWENSTDAVRLSQAIFNVYDSSGEVEFMRATAGTSTDVAFLGGRVGIGTSSPYKRFSVAGDAVVNHLTATSSISIGSDEALGEFAIYATSPDMYISRTNSAINSGSIYFTGTSGGNTTIGARVNSYNGTLSFDTDPSPTNTTAELESRLFIGSTGDVGIGGTTTPYALLSVHAQDRSGDIFVIASSSNGTATSTLLTVGRLGTTTAANGFNITDGCYAVNGTCLSTGSSVNFGSDNQVPFTNAGGTDFDYSANFTFDGSNLGIGTNAPLSAIHAVGSSTFGTGFTPVAINASNTINLIVGQNANGASNGLSFFESTNGFGMKLGYDGVGSGDANALRIYDNDDSAIFTFDNGGRFGIGSSTLSSYSSDLTISDTDRSRIVLAATDPSPDVVGFVDVRGDGTNRMQLGTFSDHDIAFFTGSSVQMLYDHSAAGLYIGGFATPGAQLHISGDDSGEELIIGDDLHLADDTTIRLNMGNSDGNSFIRTGQTSSNYLSTGWIYNATPADAYASIAVAGGNNDIVFQRDGGNVSIGSVTDPVATLQVTGTGLFGSGFTPNSGSATNTIGLIVGASSDGSANGISFLEGVSGFGMKLGYDGTGSGAANALRIYDNNDSALFTFQNGGNLGIGTTTPDAALTIGSSTQNAIAANELYNSVYIAGELELDGKFYDSANSAGTDGFVLQTDGNSVTWVSTSSLNIGGTAGSPTFTDVGTTTYLTATSDFLAVGTTSAQARLTVSANNIGQRFEQINPDLFFSGASYPGLAALSPNRIAFIESDSDDLRVYEFNGRQWNQVGVDFSLPSSGPSLAALSPNRVAYIDTQNDQLRTYEFDGNTWSLVGSGLSVDSITAWGRIAALGPNRVAFHDSDNDDLRVYEFDGSNWTQIGADYNFTSGVAALTALGPNRIAFIDSSNDDLRVYDFDGSTWHQVGTDFNISSVGHPSLTTLSPNRVVFYDDSNVDLRVYEFDGNTWSLVGVERNLSGSGTGVVTALTPNRIAFMDWFQDDLRLYQFSSPLLATTDENDMPLFSVSDTGVLTIGGPVATTTAGAINFGSQRWLTLTNEYQENSVNTASLQAAFHNESIFLDRVGIGTTSPASLLDVWGDFRVGTSGASTLFVDTSDGRVGIGTTSPASLLDVWGDFRVGTSGTPALFVDTATGRVGIGSTSPSAQLTIDGTMRIATGTPTNLAIAFGTDTNTGIYSHQADGLAIQTSITSYNFDSSSFYGGSRLYINPYGTVAEPVYTFGNDTDSGLYGSGGNILGLSAGGSSVAEFGTATSAILVGNFGIGTTSPASLLDVWGDFRVGTSSIPTLFADVSSGFVGIGSSTASSLLSIGGTNGLAFSTATSSFYSTGGIDLLNGGCFSVNGVCVGGGGSGPSFGSDNQIPFTNAGGTDFDYSANFTYNGVNNVFLDGFYTATGTVAGFAFSDRGGGSGYQWYSAGNTARLFDSTNSVDRMVLDSSGNVGIGTTSPTSTLSIYDASAVSITLENGTTPRLGTVGFNGSVTQIANNWRIDGFAIDPGSAASAINLNAGNADSSIAFYTSATNDTLGLNMILDRDGNLGVGVSDPDKRLEVFETVADSQVKISYDATRYTDFQVDSAGDLVIDAQGGDVRMNDENLWVCSGGSCPTGTPAGTGNLVVETALGVGTSSPREQVEIWNDIYVAGGGATAQGQSTSTFQGDVTILGKLDVGTIDPIYTIDGVKYATYGVSSIGIKEEVSANIRLGEYNASTGYYEHRILWSDMPEASDLWLFYQVTDFGAGWNNLIVNLTSSFDGSVFYEKDLVNNALVIKSQSAGEVAVGLEADRFDASTWSNVRPDQNSSTTHFVLPRKD